MTTSPKTLWNRNLTAAKRSLKLVLETGQEHLDILEGGEVPEGSFAPSFTKYLEALGNLRVLDRLGENSTDEEATDGEVSVSRDGLAALIELLRASDVGFAIQDAADGSVLAGIVATVGTGEPEDDREPVTRGGYPVGP